MFSASNSKRCSDCEAPTARWYVTSKEDGTKKTVKDTKNRGNSSGNLTFVSKRSWVIGETKYLWFPDVKVQTGDSTSVDCHLCPRKCHIIEGNTGFCSTRFNDYGILRSVAYGRPSSIAIDPIEKKPFFHFLPSARVLSLGTFGCNLSCSFCQNWRLSQDRSAFSWSGRYISPSEVVSLALSRNCSCVAFTYNEPTIWAEYVLDVAKLCKSAKIKTLVVSNGFIEAEARKDLYGVVDGANIDLKGFTQSFYRELTGGALKNILETLKYVANETDVWLEVTNLLIPSFNTDLEDLKRMCDWYVESLGESVPLHFSAFFPTWKLTSVPCTDLQILNAASQVAKERGVRYVYTGNVDDKNGLSTFCPKCGALLIVRDYRYNVCVQEDLNVLGVNELSTTKAMCRCCGEKIEGIWK